MAITKERNTEPAFPMCSGQDLGIITLTKHPQALDTTAASREICDAGAPEKLPGGMIAGVLGDRGVAIYPGQSPAEVLMIAAVLERELEDVGHYLARSVARKILLAQTAGCSS
jgi:hypothetical protein